MTRNIEHRIEVTCPVFDKTIKNEIKEIFAIQWSDNVKARKIDASLSNKFVKPEKKQFSLRSRFITILKELMKELIIK